MGFFVGCWSLGDVYHCLGVLVGGSVVQMGVSVVLMVGKVWVKREKGTGHQWR